MSRYKWLENRQKIIVVMLIVAIAGTALIGGSLASNTSPIEISVKSFKTYPTNAVTQLERVDITVQIMNNSLNVFQIAPGLQMQLIDSNGLSHPVTADYLTPGVVVGGPLAPGATWTEPIDFDLSAGQTPAKFIFQADNLSTPVDIGL